MPWTYSLHLASPTDAGTIQTDWQDNIPGNAQIKHEYGGVTSQGRRAIIVSERNNPEYKDMEDFAYVNSITEQKEIPTAGQGLSPPVDLGAGFTLPGGQTIDGVEFD